MQRADIWESGESGPEGGVCYGPGRLVRGDGEQTLGGPQGP